MPIGAIRCNFGKGGAARGAGFKVDLWKGRTDRRKRRQVLEIQVDDWGVSEWLAATLEMSCRAIGCEFESRALRWKMKPSTNWSLAASFRFGIDSSDALRRRGEFVHGNFFAGRPAYRIEILLVAQPKVRVG